MKADRHIVSAVRSLCVLWLTTGFGHLTEPTHDKNYISSDLAAGMVGEAFL
jgi:hypothetical protein